MSDTLAGNDWRVEVRDAARGSLALGDGSVDLACFSPPYLVGKAYESDLDYARWARLLERVFAGLARALRPGRVAAVVIADVRCHPDPALAGVHPATPERRTAAVSRGELAQVLEAEPHLSRAALARRFAVSPQTVLRRLEGAERANRPQRVRTRILLTADRVATLAADAGLYLDDARVWAKDPAWSSSRWHATSYRAIDDHERILFFRRPGPYEHRRARLAPEEWGEWGSRGIWWVASVQRNDRHEAEMPEALAERIVRLHCEPGELVLDPFAGTGTTLAVARRLGRRALGFERDPATARLARARIADPRYAPPPGC